MLFLTLLQLGNGCYLKNSSQKWDSVYLVTEGSEIWYNLNIPDQRYTLPRELDEISGLSYFKPGKLAAVQDEMGDVFIFDLATAEVSDKISFYKEGDYEGVELVGNDFFVVKSNGRLFRFTNPASNRSENTNEIKTPLRSENNVEGLAWDEQRNLLLLACKEKSGYDNRKFRGRSIYGYDLSNDKFLDDPVYLIGHDSFLDAIEEFSLIEDRHMPFKPSGLAVHPITQELYIINAVGNIMIVMDRDSRIKKLVPLNPDLMSQPEGICFDPEGNLYIASEAGEGNAYLFSFLLKSGNY